MTASNKGFAPAGQPANADAAAVADSDPLRAAGASGDASPNAQAVLDDLAFPMPSQTLGADDLKLLQAIQQVLEARQADAWIEKIKAQISAELEWE